MPRLSRTTREAAKFVSDDLKKMKENLAKQGKTLDDWLEEKRIENAKIRERRLKREAKQKGEQ